MPSLDAFLGNVTLSLHLFTSTPLRPLPLGGYHPAASLGHPNLLGRTKIVNVDKNLK